MRPLFSSGDLTYTLIFWGVFAFWIIFELIVSGLKRTHGNSNPRDRGSLILIVVLFWLALALAFAASFHVPQASIPGNRKSVFFLGIATMLVGMILRWHAMSVLGRFFTVNVAIQSGHALVQNGPYRYIRHPSYTGALITQTGFAIALGNWLSVAAILVCMGIAYTYRISVEESALSAALGSAYQDYVRRTRRLIPFLF